MRTITISISVPDGVDFHVTAGPPPDDFEHEPLPDPDRFGPDADLPPSNGHQEPVSLRRDTMTAVAVAPAPVAAPARMWAVGEVHQQGHKPLKSNRRGLFCPTSLGKDPNGETIFCPWRP